MYNYMVTLVKNASYKAVRNYKSLEVADNRAKIEEEIRATVMETLKAEKLDTSMTLSVVQIRNVQPNAEILAAATAYVKSQNDLKIKENEVKLAKLEAERQSAVSNVSQQSIAFMQARAMADIAEGVKNGKVSSIVVPYDFKGILQVGK